MKHYGRGRAHQSQNLELSFSRRFLTSSVTGSAAPDSLPARSRLPGSHIGNSNKEVSRLLLEDVRPQSRGLQTNSLNAPRLGLWLTHERHWTSHAPWSISIRSFSNHSHKTASRASEPASFGSKGRSENGTDRLDLRLGCFASGLILRRASQRQRLCLVRNVSKKDEYVQNGGEAYFSAKGREITHHCRKTTSRTKTSGSWDAMYLYSRHC